MYRGNARQGRFCAWGETFTLPFLPPQPGTLGISTTNQSFRLAVRWKTIAVGFFMVYGGATYKSGSRDGTGIEYGAP